MKKLKNNSNSGFTIVELLIVIVVIAILSAVSFVAYRNIQEQAREASISAELKSAERAILAYAAQNEALPNDLAAAGIKGSGAVTFEYEPNEDGTFCITGTNSNVSMNMSQTGIITEGGCPGHGVGGVAAITNFAPNPGFELSRDGWGWQNGSGYSGSISTAQKHSGNSSFAITAPASGVADRYFENYVYTGATGTYTISAYAYLTATGETHQNRDVLFAMGIGPGVNVGPDPKYDRTKTNQWQRITRTVTFTQPTSAVRIRFYAPLGGTIYIDSVMLTPGTTAPAYADGSSPGWKWLGTPHNSASRGAPK